MRATNFLVVTTDTEAMPTLRPRSVTKARPFQVVTESGYSISTVARPFPSVSSAGIHKAVSAKNSRTETGAMAASDPRTGGEATGMLASALAISPIPTEPPSAPVTTTEFGLLFSCRLALRLISRLDRA